MLRNNLLLILLLIAVSANAQVQISNLTASHPDKRILYLGVDNKFIFQSGSEKVNEILVDGGRVFHFQNDSFSIRPAKPGKVLVTFVTKKGRQQIFFDAMLVPNFQLDIQGLDFATNQPHHYSRVWLDSILAFGKIRIVSWDTSEFFKDYKVKSCILRIRDEEFEMKGENIPEPALAVISKLQSKEKIKLQYLFAGKTNLPKQNLYSPGIFTFQVR